MRSRMPADRSTERSDQTVVVDVNASSQNRIAPSNRSAVSAAARRLDPDEPVEHRADQRSLGAAASPALPSAVGGQPRRRPIAGQDATPRFAQLDPPAGIQIVPLRKLTDRHITVESGETGLRVQREQERRDVAATHDRLRVRPYRFEIDEVEVAEHPPATVERHDPADRGVIAEEPVQFRRGVPEARPAHQNDRPGTRSQGRLPRGNPNSRYSRPLGREARPRRGRARLFEKHGHRDGVAGPQGVRSDVRCHRRASPKGR